MTGFWLGVALGSLLTIGVALVWLGFGTALWSRVERFDETWRPGMLSGDRAFVYACGYEMRPMPEHPLNLDIGWQLYREGRADRVAGREAKCSEKLRERVRR